ncbi:MAG: secretin N-terminal domain-containing protein [Parvularculaceae bacterium]|nr:secretin N-terminal domain-containing protein [Parvularculaceae bacterium]
MTTSRTLAILAMASALPACAVTKPDEPLSITAHKSSIEQAQARLDGEAAPVGKPADTNTLEPNPDRSTTVPSISPARIVEADADGRAPPLGEDDVDAVVAPLTLPAFIDVAFGEILKAPYVTGEGVAARADVVQLRSSGMMAPETFLDLVRTALANYGISIVADNGVFQIVENATLKARLPRFVRSRSRAETPASLRPVVQFVELNAIRAADMARILEQAFTSREDKLKIEADDGSNYLILSGLSDDVDAAISIIEEMDELQYAGTEVRRYTPRYWDASALTQELLNVLTAEGWQASGSTSQPLPILLLSVAYSNDILIFSRTPQARARALYWIKELDRPTQRDDGSQIYVYNVRNIDAALLAETAGAAIDSAEGAAEGSAGPGATGASAGGQPSGARDRPRSSGRFVVDPYGNRIIFSGTANEYDRIRPLLETLDTPTPEVLIEVMIAQVTLSDGLSSGVEWVIDNVGGSNLGGVVAQQGLGLGGAGLIFSIFPRNAEVNLSALASNNKVDVLSTPRLVARSGASAQVQVGTEVPILSAQRLPQGPSGGDTNVDVISSVEYRSTGVILQIEPIVFSDDRIDLNISQQVSAALPTAGPIASPTFSNTSVTTQLSLEDGATAVIGGLIQNSVTRDEQGIPLLKDIPVLGNAFSSRSTSVERSELVILITAYVMRDRNEKRQIADELARKIDEALNEDSLVTLRARHFN